MHKQQDDSQHCDDFQSQLHPSEALDLWVMSEEIGLLRFFVGALQVHDKELIHGEKEQQNSDEVDLFVEFGEVIERALFYE